MAEPAIRDISTIFGFWPSRPADVSLETLCAILDKHGVARAATFSTLGVFVDSRQGNDVTWRAAQDNPRLLPMGIIDPRAGLRCPEELAERVEQGFRIFSLLPETQGWSLEDACFGEALRVAAEAGVLVMVEASRQGWPTLIARLAERYRARVILWGVGYRNFGEALMVMKHNPDLLLETHLLTAADAIETAVDEVGSERLLFGSYAPLKYFSSAYLRVKFAEVAEADRGAVLGGNFARLLEGA